MIEDRDLFVGFDFEPDSTEPINFMDSCWFYLSPFSAHEIVIDEVTFKTAEHAYQALRIKSGNEHESIRNAASPKEAWRICQQYKHTDLLIVDFDKKILMEKVFRAKLEQHEDIRIILTATGDRELVKEHDTDKYWGRQNDGAGENQMGELWMKLRAELK